MKRTMNLGLSLVCGSSLATQCLNQRVGTMAQLRSIIAAWKASRTGGKVSWRFTTAAARIKLRRLYPSIPTRTVESDTTQAAGEQVTSTRGTAVEQAVASIAKARCARESRCSNVGSGKKYATESECLTKLESEKYDDLNGEECLGGIDQKELAECLEEIDDQDCNNPLDAVGQVAACRSSDLCRALPR